MDSTYAWCEPDPEWDEWHRSNRAARRQYANCITAERFEMASQWYPEPEVAEAHKVATKEQKQKLLKYLNVEALKHEEEAIKCERKAIANEINVIKAVLEHVKAKEANYEAMINSLKNQLEAIKKIRPYNYEE
jgi:hypothetical protein